ncbi:hypothetical protein J4233_03720 [Candidatus Pacearchaeota archaeon]|nr:hypothetical protein [Candidatus Pacearchaeota archaeon]
MRIPVRVEFFAGGLRPVVTLTIRSEIPHIFGFVNAVIDTGSPTTILGAGDVQRMRISQIQMQKLTGEEKEVNLGGAQIKTRILSEANLSVGEKLNVKIPVQIPVKITKGTPPPSIIGVDFLLEGKLKFLFDPNAKEAYLETSD